MDYEIEGSDPLDILLRAEEEEVCEEGGEEAITYLEM